MKSNTIWALVTGLAVGYIIGREFTSRPAATGGGESGPVATAPHTHDSAGGGGGAGGPIPSTWIKEDEIGATSDFAALTPAQRYIALKVLNERPCDCGCPHGSVAKCKKEDPGCPRAPSVIQQTIALAKQGKQADEIVAAIKKPDNAPAAQPPAGAPQKVELAAWTPVKGPKYAKVTVLEFSDFQ
jgi:hypothetical protein